VPHTSCTPQHADRGPAVPPPQLVPAEVVRQFPGAMLNVHPALLPAFGGKGCYGKKVHQAVIACGAR
jgi:formyltetrahydrofolate hydrolase